MEMISVANRGIGKILCILGLTSFIASCSAERLEDQADRSDVIEFSSAHNGFSSISETTKLFSLKKKIIREGGTLLQNGNLLCIMLPDENSGSLSFSNQISFQFDLWIERNAIEKVMVWKNGSLEDWDIFALQFGAVVDSKKLGDRLRYSYGERGEGWSSLKIPIESKRKK